MQLLASVPKVIPPRDLYKLVSRLLYVVCRPLQRGPSVVPEQLNISCTGKRSHCSCCIHPARPAGEHWCKGQSVPTKLFASTNDLWVYFVFFPILLLLLPQSYQWSYFLLPTQKLVPEGGDGLACFVISTSLVLSDSLS